MSLKAHINEKEGEKMDDMKERLIDFFKNEANRPLKVDEIREQLNLDEGGSETFKTLVKSLNELEQAGELILTRKDRFYLPEKIGLIKGKIQMHKKGFAFLLPEDESREDVYINPKIGRASCRERA